MNRIVLRGVVRNIQPSHNVAGNQFDSAQLVVKNSDGTDSVITLKFKHTPISRVEEGDYISLVGNVRSYSYNDGNKNHVELYVYTYFDTPEATVTLGDTIENYFSIDGNICKKSRLRMYPTPNIQFIIANNIVTADNKKLNSYLSCSCYKEYAYLLSQLDIGTHIKIEGELRSRTYVKQEDGEDVIHVAHELFVTHLGVSAE